MKLLQHSNRNILSTSEWYSIDRIGDEFEFHALLRTITWSIFQVLWKSPVLLSVASENKISIPSVQVHVRLTSSYVCVTTWLMSVCEVNFPQQKKKETRKLFVLELVNQIEFSSFANAPTKCAITMLSQKQFVRVLFHCWCYFRDLVLLFFFYLKFVGRSCFGSWKKKNKLDSINMAFSHLLTAVFILPMENYQSFIPDRIDFDSLFSVYWKAQLSYVMAHFQFKRETILPESQNKFDDLCIRILNCSNNN